MKEVNSSDDDNKILDSSDDEEEVKNVKEIEKIVCPECGLIPILEIDGKNYIIKSYCPKKHQNQEKLIDFIEQSKKQLDKDKGIIKCSGCSKTNEELKIKKDDMYLCACNKYFCEKCKDEHEGIENDDENQVEHSLIKYSEKDFQCRCSNSFLDYECFCLNCNENLCCNCQVEHKDKNPDHVIIYYSDEIDKYLTEDQIKKKKKNILKTKKKQLINL